MEFYESRPPPHRVLEVGHPANYAGDGRSRPCRHLLKRGSGRKEETQRFLCLKTAER